MSKSQRMLVALEAQDLNKAEKYLQEALVEDDASILLELGNYLEGIGFYPQAKQVYEGLVAVFPEVYLNLASIVSEDGDLEQAFAYLEEIKPESDWYATSLLVKADLYQQEGLVDIAREKLVEALEYSDDDLLHFGLAELDFELGNYHEAIKSYAQLDNRLLYQQTGVSTYQRIGLAYAHLGKFELATEFLEKALELEYEDQTAYALASLYLDQKEYQKAALYFKQLDTISPDFEGYHYGYSQALHQEHQTQEALEVAKKGIEKNPFETRLYLQASQLSYELHQKKEAENFLLQAQADAEDTEEIFLRLATMYQEDDRYEDILALGLDESDNLLTKWIVAQSYYELEELDKAISMYQELAQDLKDNPEFLEQYIYLLREMGDAVEARAQAENYLKKVPDDLTMQEFYQQLLEENSFF